MAKNHYHELWATGGSSSHNPHALTTQYAIPVTPKGKTVGHYVRLVFNLALLVVLGFLAWKYVVTPLRGRFRGSGDVAAVAATFADRLPGSTAGSDELREKVSIAMRDALQGTGVGKADWYVGYGSFDQEMQNLRDDGFEPKQHAVLEKFVAEARQGKSAGDILRQYPFGADSHMVSVAGRKWCVVLAWVEHSK